MEIQSCNTVRVLKAGIHGWHDWFRVSMQQVWHYQCNSLSKVGTETGEKIVSENPEQNDVFSELVWYLSSVYVEIYLLSTLYKLEKSSDLGSDAACFSCMSCPTGYSKARFGPVSIFAAQFFLYLYQKTRLVYLGSFWQMILNYCRLHKSGFQPERLGVSVKNYL